VSLRCDQLIPVNKAVNEKEQLEKGLEEEEEKKDCHVCQQSFANAFCLFIHRSFTLLGLYYISPVLPFCPVLTF
jgi:hypothetical protein